jgi:hypothetical protein
MKLAPLLCLLTAASANAQQIIEFESNRLHFKTMTRSGITVMWAYLPAHLKEFSILQVSISNGSPIAWTVKPEDFSYRQPDGAVARAWPALAVVNSLLSRAGRRDVIKLVTTYEDGVYGNINMHSTNGYEKRRETALAEGMSPKLKAGAAASAIALIPAKLKPGESTDGAVFFPNAGKPFGPGTLVVNTGGEVFEFPTDGEPVPSK